MKKRIKHIEEHRKAFEIEIPPVELNRKREELFEKVSRSAKVPGFRAGRAPRDLVERRYGEDLTKEAIECLIASSYHKALEEEGFVPLGLPKISEVRLDEASALFFNAEFNIRPKINLKAYKGLKLNRRRIEVKEEDVQKSINVLQGSNAKFKGVEGRPAQVGDYIVCDSEIFADGKTIAKKRENIWMLIEEESYIPDLSKQLVGAGLNEERQVEVILPNDFPSKEYAGRKAVFKIKIKEIKEKVLPQIDDEFAKDLGYNNLSELSDSVKRVLKEQAGREARRDLENQVIEKLLEMTDFNVPAALVEEQTKHLVKDQRERLIRQGLKEDDIKTKEEELTAKLRPIALKQVKTMFILDEIGNKEDIRVSKEEADEDGAIDIRNAKVLEFLIKEAEIEEAA